MLQIDVGDNASAASDIIPITVSSGATVNLANVAGSSLNYYLNGIDGAATALTVGNNVNLTQSSWMQSAGITTVQLTGGLYG